MAATGLMDYLASVIQEMRMHICDHYSKCFDKTEHQRELFCTVCRWRIQLEDCLQQWSDIEKAIRYGR